MKFILMPICLLVQLCLFAQTQKADLILHDISIVDVLHNRIQAHQTVVISNGRILEVGKSGIDKKYNSRQSILSTGKYMMPSLWDMHVHFGGDTLREENKWLLPLFIAMGVTTVRDCAGDISDDVLEWKKEIAENKLVGPTIFTSGPKLEGPKSIWPGDLEIANETEMNIALDSLQKLKVDFIKITDNALDPALFVTSIKASRKRGWKVSGHAPVQYTLNELSDAGLSTVEHLGYMLRAASKNEERITALRRENKINAKEAATQLMQSIDSATAIRKFKLLAANGTAVVPTMNGSYITTYLDQDNHQHDDYLKYLGPALKRTYAWRVDRASKDDAQAIVARHQSFETAAHLIPWLYQAGVPFLAGTDAGYLNSFNYPGIGLHYELAMMVYYGLPIHEALKSSVINGPAFFNQSKDFGAVEKDKIADLLILDANPLIDIHNTQKIFALIRKGTYLNRTTIDNMLSMVAQKVATKEATEKK
ncbi:MAG: amidohydrolase family protein [Bacteroidetes bacterium]|nr:amidohydrolase family protein [Bacteroidota bacterium]